jgi:hypothetical protein
MSNATQRLLHWSFHLAAAIASALFVATFTLWVRSCEVQDSFHRFSHDAEYHLSVSLGTVRFFRSDPSPYARMLPAGMVRTTYRHETLRPPRTFHEPAYLGERVTFDRFGLVLWNVRNTPGVPRMEGLNFPCWWLVVLFALPPSAWFLFFRVRRPRLQASSGFEVSPVGNARAPPITPRLPTFRRLDPWWPSRFAAQR